MCINDIELSKAAYKDDLFCTRCYYKEATLAVGISIYKGDTIVVDFNTAYNP
jgi:uncharacterized protein (DUF1684 family)